MEPIIEQIAEKVRDRLALTLDADSAVRPLRINDDAAGDYKITLTQGESSINAEVSCQGNPPGIAYNQVFVITGELRPSETSDVSIDTFRNRFTADITIALTDADGWHTWDGLAKDTQIGPVAFRQSAESSWLEIRMLVIYRVDENNPYQVR